MTKDQLMKCKKTNDFCKLLVKLGFSHVRTTGSHMIYKNNSGLSVPVPNKREMSPGTKRDICKIIFGYDYSQQIEIEKPYYLFQSQEAK